MRAPTTRGSNFGRGWGLPQLFLFPQKNVQGPSPGGGWGGAVGGGAGRPAPESGFGLPPPPRHSPSKEGAVEVSSRESPLPLLPRLRFPQTGSSDHTQAWGWDQQVELGSGAWQAGGRGRERQGCGAGRNARKEDQGRQRDRGLRKAKKQHRKSQRCGRREKSARNPGELRNNKERERGVMFPKSFWIPCLIFHHQAPRASRSQTLMLLQFATAWVKQGCDQVAKEAKCHQRVEITVGS